MSADKSRAARLADELDDAVQTRPQEHEDEPGGYCTEFDACLADAAAELRRQDESIRELVEALHNTLHELWSARHGYLSRQDFEKEFADEFAAIAKHKEASK